QIDVVVASRDFVGGAREREDGRRDPSGQIPPEQPRDEDSSERGDRQPLQEWNQLLVQFGLRLRHDQVAECGPLLPQLQGTRDGEIGLLCARWRELERDRPTGTPGPCALRQAFQSYSLVGNVRDADVKETIAGRTFELPRDARQWHAGVVARDRLLREDFGQPDRLTP